METEKEQQNTPTIGAPFGIFRAMCQLMWTYKTFMIKRMKDKSVKVYKYGNKRRQSMDIYLPHYDESCADDDKNSVKDVKDPCMIISIGSGWIFGHKLFGIPFGYFGQKLGYVTIVIDYPRYPFSNVNNQINDCTNAINWVFDNVEEKFNGDTNCVNIATYSAAGHIVLRSLFNRLYKNNKDDICWKAQDINSVFLWACPFDLERIYTYHQNDKSVTYCMNKLFDNGIKNGCVTHRLKQMIDANEIEPTDIPPIYIGNGDIDTTCLFESAQKFHRLLKNNGFITRLHSINGWKHLDFAFKDTAPLAWYMHSTVMGIDNPFINSDVLTEHYL